MAIIETNTVMVSIIIVIEGLDQDQLIDIIELIKIEGQDPDLIQMTDIREEKNMIMKKNPDKMPSFLMMM